MVAVSVLIVNYNGRPYLDEVLASLQGQTLCPYEVVVVDNASTDGSADWVREAFPAVRLLVLSENVGFAEGTNRAASLATGDLLALLNSDAVADPGWLAESVRVLEDDPRAAAAVPKILRGSCPGRIEQAGALFNNIGNYWGRGFAEPDDERFDEMAEVPGLTACAAVLRRAALGDGPLFDSTLFMYAEEFDLTLRLRAAGHTIVYAPRAVVRHGGMQSIRQASARPLLFQQFFTNRNRLKILARYYPVGVLLRSLPAILLSLVYWNAFFLLRGGPLFLLRALRAQTSYALQGWRARRRGHTVRAETWLPWMTHMGLRELWGQRRRAHSG